MPSNIAGWINDHVGEEVCINVETRDLGYGTDIFSVEGYFNGFVDWFGKFTFFDAHSEDVFYLFPDEIEIC